MRNLLVLLLLITWLFSVGCSRSGLVDNLELNPMIATAQSNSIGILGANELTINPVEMTAELISRRIPYLGESYLVNGTSFFVTQPCSDCLEIEKIGVTPEGYVELGFKARHPFEAGDPLEPPSGRNRLDLDIFDLVLIVVPLEKTPTSFSMMNTSVYDGLCPYADGYTRELETLISDSAACPYYLVVDDNEDGTYTFNEFSMGANQSFSTYFDISSVLKFDLYLTFGYGVSAQRSIRLHPFYFNPEFNRKNAWKVEVIPPEPGETWTSDDNVQTRKVTVKVWDWQHGVTTIVNPPVESSDIAFASDVSSVAIEIPGMCSALQTATEPVSGTGCDPDAPLIYELQIANENLLPEGEYLSVVKVTDERVPPSDIEPGMTDTLAHSSDGFSLEWHVIPEFATYQTFIAAVIDIPCEAMEEVMAGSFSALQTEYLSIIRDKTAWEDFYFTHDPYGIPPTIDFDTKMAVVVFIGGRSSSGFYVTMDCVKLFPNLIDVTFTEHIPGAG